MEQPLITDSEWEVMRVIWNMKKATAQDVIDNLSVALNWKPATVKTLLGRLVKKEALTTQQVGKKFIYSPKVSEAITLKIAVSDLFSHVCAKKGGETIADIIRQIELTREDIDLLKETLSEKTSVKSIKCNCIKGQCNCCTQEGEG